jgi:hypothetical protein
MKAKFIEAVESGNLLRVRLFLTNELLLDPRGGTFLEMKVFAEKHLDNLYDIDDSKYYVFDESVWNEELLFKLKNDLDENFSKEKLSVYTTMAKVVLKDKIEELKNQEANRSARITASTNDINNNKKKKQSVNTLYVGITVGGVAITLTGLCLSRMVLASVGLAGVVIGGILLYKNLEK